MGWVEARVTLDSNGVGNVNVPFPLTSLLLAVAIEQASLAGMVSGQTDIVISHLLPTGRALPVPLLTLTNVTLPFYAVGPQATPVNASNVAQSNYVYQGVQSLNVSITQGSASQTASVWLLLSD